MKLKKRDAALTEALSGLAPVDYSSSPVLADVYQRLLQGRDAFAEIYELNVNAVSEISALDLEIQFYTEQLLNITQSVANATKDIHTAASESAEVSGIVAGRHEDPLSLCPRSPHRFIRKLMTARRVSPESASCQRIPSLSPSRCKRI